ncbi:MAG TPA: hypothetical protein VLN41_02305 [Candidatus Bathyarchaeia archaeon]|nr:hypothetical protein [Candidatus Bathyarchaeia archaeon]
MTKRTPASILVIAFCASLGLAQQPLKIKPRPVQTKMKIKNVAVVDLRTARPLAAKVQAARPNLKPVTPPAAVRVVPQAMSVAQVRASLVEAGIGDVSPAGEYALFTPTQLSAGNKGHMLLQAPLWVDSNMVQFDGTADQNEWLHIVTGPKVRLFEAGAYVLDFLVDFPDADPRQTFRCDVVKGEDVFQQIEVARDSAGPQHILVVFQQAATSPQNPWIGVCLHNTDYVSGLDWIRWYLYQVTVTKL